jgi:hypothetical protein
MSIQALAKYVMEHADRGTCRCGKCMDHPGVDSQPIGHTADVVFFDVSQHDANADELRTLIVDSKEGEFGMTVNPFDGNEHNYMELGGWIGDQGLALMLMGIGKILGLWSLLTPKMLPGIPDDLVMQMAGMGMISIQATKETE